MSACIGNVNSESEVTQLCPKYMHRNAGKKVDVVGVVDVLIML